MRKTVRNNTAHTLYILLVPLCIAFFAVASFAGAQRDLAWLRGKCTNGQGALAWRNNSDNRVKMLDVATGNTTDLGNSSWIAPRFSPNGSKIAWIDGTTAKGKMRNESSSRVIITGVEANYGIHWITNDEVVVRQSGTWYRVNTNGTKQAVSALSSVVGGTTELDIRLQGNGVWSAAWTSGSKVYFKSSDGKSGTVPNVTCSASLSPDGKSAAGLEHGHDRSTFKNFYTNSTGTVGRTAADCGDKGFDNHRWSSSDARFITAQYECSNKFGIWEISTSDCYIAGAAGGESYGDFANGPVSGTWSTATAPVDPVMICDISNLSFSAVQDQSNPGSKTVDLYTEAGTLTGVSVSDNGAWLTVTAGAASGTRITLTNAVNIAGLAAGNHTATVTVTSGNAGNVSYTVTLTVTAFVPPDPLVLTRPNGGETYTVGQTLTVQFNADETVLSKGVDIYLSVDNGLSWSSIVGTASVTAGGTGWENFSWVITETVGGMSVVSSDCKIKVQDYDEGTGIVDVSESAFTIKAAPDPGSLHLKYNCGGPATGDWLAADQYASGGTPYTFSGTFSTSGVTDAAPAAIYSTCRHRVSGQETGFSYTFDVPDGDYTVRLHFGDQNATRAIDITVEGERVVSDMDIVTEAGAAFTALVVTKSAVVSDGNGMTIEINDDRASPADVLISGVEILAAGQATILAPAAHRTLYGTTAWYTLKPGAVAVSIPTGEYGTARLINASGAVVLNRAIQGGHEVNFMYTNFAAGAYVLQVMTNKTRLSGRIIITR